MVQFLEAAGPLTLLGAQIVYFSEPWLKSLLPNAQLDLLAQTFEEPSQRKAFIALLKETELQ